MSDRVIGWVSCPMCLFDNQWFVRYIKMHIIESYDLHPIRANLASTMDRVRGNQEAVIITRNGDQAVAMLSLRECKTFEETACLCLLLRKRSINFQWLVIP